MATTAHRSVFAGRDRKDLRVKRICTAVLVIALTTGVGLARGQGGGAASAAGQTAGNVAVGVVCEGGMLLPVAVRSQGAWRSLTDDGKAQAGAPLKLTSEATRLPRSGWTIVPFDANVKSRALTLEGSANETPELDAEIGAADVSVRTFVVEAREDLQIARDVRAVLG